MMVTMDRIFTLGASSSKPAAVLVATAFIAYVIYRYMWESNVKAWRQEFANRPNRGSSRAVSSEKRPRVKSVNFTKVANKRGSVFSSFTGMSKALANAVRGLEKKGNMPKPSKNYILDMDHLHVPLSTYLFAMLFIGPPAVLLWVSGISTLKFREFLYKRGLITPKAHDPSMTVTKLLLNSMEAVHYIGQKNRVATFCFDNFPMLDVDGNFVAADLFTVDIHLDEKRMIKATLDSRELTAVDAMVLVWFATISSDHVKVHSLANWAAPFAKGLQNPFQDRMNRISIIYNHFGFSTFKNLCKLWHSIGWASCNFAGIVAVFQSGLDAGVPKHSQINELKDDSEVIRFITILRGKFFQLFRKHQNEFQKDIDPESLYASTVIHSLDHTLMEWNMEDALWLLDPAISPEMRTMAEIGRLVRASFVEDLPLIWFTKRYKTAPGDFCQGVYKEAAKINQKLADNMDTCIIK